MGPLGPHLEDLFGRDAAGLPGDRAVRPTPLLREKRRGVKSVTHWFGGTPAIRNGALAGRGRLARGDVVLLDVMDGRYSLPASVRRSNLATAAARLGVDTRIVGFSWSDRARSPARRSLAAAGRSGVRLLLRDPVSAARARQTASTRCTRSRTSSSPRARSTGRLAALLLDGISRPVALVNVSGLLAGHVDQLEEYVAVVDDLRLRGLHVLIVPHVWRERAGTWPRALPWRSGWARPRHLCAGPHDPRTGPRSRPRGRSSR